MLNVWEILRDRISGKALPGERRSSKWRKVRATHLEKNPKCEICGSSKKLEVHHILPFNVAPDQELVSDNLISLCQRKKYGINCHLLIGHLGNFRKFNSGVVADALYWRAKLKKHDLNDPI